ncbi:RsmD family RNA methyltransferase [Myxococcota bacterium]|nr:RsmD family RNA methyltransferase [Myxococcota bacterium]
MLAAQASRPRFAKGLAAALRALELPVEGLAVDGRAVQGDATLSLSAGGVTHQVGPAAFTQVHLDVNRQLVAAVQQAVADLVGRAAGDLRGVAVLDLYAGYGNLGLPLCRQGATLAMIESNPAACQDARRTAAALGLPVDVRAGDAGAFRAGDAFFDVAVLDPPRAGADRLLSQVIVTRPQGIVFVSCNPGHLGRDLRPALQAGYRLETVQAFDMFPLTPHVEVLAVLRRG